MNLWLLPFLLLGFIGDQFDGNGLKLVTLQAGIEREHELIKNAVDCDSMTFRWEICSLAQFPVLSGQNLPYFPDHARYRALDDVGDAVYVVDDRTVYVGTRYWYLKPGQGLTDVDTTYYRIIEYHICRSMPRAPYYVWERRADVKTIICRFNEPVDIKGYQSY